MARLNSRILGYILVCLGTEWFSIAVPNSMYTVITFHQLDSLSSLSLWKLKSGVVFFP